MVKYSISTHNYIGSGPTVVAKEGDAEIPAVIFSQLDRDSPLDMNVLARNFVSLVNGHTPQETSPFAGRSIQYEGFPHAVTLRFRDEHGGVSKNGLMITVNQSAPNEIVQELEAMIDADFVGKLCATTPAHMVTAPAPAAHSKLNH